MARFIPPCSSVLDVGAGAQGLAEFLPLGCAYQALDCVAGPGVLVLDLDELKAPPFGHRYDVVVCAGVLEYLRDPLGMLAHLGQVTDRLIWSYAHGYAPESRLKSGWVNDLHPSQFMPCAVVAWWGGQFIYLR